MVLAKREQQSGRLAEQCGVSDLSKQDGAGSSSRGGEQARIAYYGPLAEDH
jgi:hypothetical protein